MEAMKYRKKPVVIEAMHFTRGSTPGVGYEIAQWCGGRFNTDVKPSDYTDVRYSISIPTLEGVMTADEGDYVIKGVAGALLRAQGSAWGVTPSHRQDMHRGEARTALDAARAVRDA